MQHRISNMNMESPLFASQIDNEWSKIEDEFDLWRGRCVDEYTKVERGISEALILLHKKFGKRVNLRTGYLFGQKLALLTEALALPELRDLKLAKKAAAANAKFQQFAELRNTLCHSYVTLYRSRDGSHIIELKTTRFNSHENCSVDVFLDRMRAEDLLKALKSAVQSLTSSLSNLCGAQEQWPGNRKA